MRAPALMMSGEMPGGIGVAVIQPILGRSRAVMSVEQNGDGREVLRSSGLEPEYDSLHPEEINDMLRPTEGSLGCTFPLGFLAVTPLKSNVPSGLL